MSCLRLTGLTGKLALLLILQGICNEPCAAYEMTLPDVGTNVGYNFHTETPEFLIAESIGPEEAIRSRVTFADGKYLRTKAEADVFLFGVDIDFEAPGIADLFEPILNPFDETLSLLGKEGLPLATTENGGVLYPE
ncbi:MAG TPA: hypothetical protein VF175_09840, partial [Lacipirellula sp.]